MGRDGSQNTVLEDHEVEEDEPNDKKVCKDEVFEGESPTEFAGELGYGVV